MVAYIWRRLGMKEMRIIWIITISDKRSSPMTGNNTEEEPERCENKSNRSHQFNYRKPWKGGSEFHEGIMMNDAERCSGACTTAQSVALCCRTKPFHYHSFIY
jgi:hypothetical protein